MNPLVTNREQLLHIAAATLATLESESFQAKLDEGAVEAPAEPGAPSLDMVTNSLSESLEWARMEEQTLDSAELEAVGTGPAPYIPSNQVLSLVQSAYEEYLEGKEEDLLEEPFDGTDVGWASVALEKIKSWLKGKRKFVSHKNLTDFRYDLPANAVVALFADWGTGEPTAVRVMEQIKKAAPTHAIHMGDVYYAGTPGQAKKRFLDVIDQHGPSRQACRYFSLNANHDMYSGGYGYFDTILRGFGQEASYFNLRNEHWQLIGIDSGYEEHGLKDPQKDWVAAQLSGGGGAKSIMVSHHQYFSSYEKGAYNRALHTKMGPMLGQVFAWFWGHEHRCMIFGDHLGIKARCIGHGAIPEAVPFGARKFPDVPVIASDERESPQDPGMGVHGFALLRLAGSQMDVSYVDEFGTVFFKEQLMA